MGVSRHLEVSLLGGSCFSKGPTSSLPSFLRDSYLRGSKASECDENHVDPAHRPAQPLSPAPFLSSTVEKSARISTFDNQ